jgi:hypothetical protein
MLPPKWFNHDGAFLFLRRKLIWNKFQLEVIDMDGIKIDKVNG